MYPRIVGNTKFEPRSIIRAIEEDFQYTISYSKAWRAREKVIEMRFVMYETSYDNVPKFSTRHCLEEPWNIS